MLRWFMEKKLAAVPVKLSPISLTMQPAAKIEWILGSQNWQGTIAYVPLVSGNASPYRRELLFGEPHAHVRIEMQAPCRGQKKRLLDANSRSVPAKTHQLPAARPPLRGEPRMVALRR